MEERCDGIAECFERSSTRMRNRLKIFKILQRCTAESPRLPQEADGEIAVGVAVHRSSAYTDRYNVVLDSSLRGMGISP